MTYLGCSKKTRDTREGWPLLTIETEVNGDSKTTNERGPSLVGLLGLSCRYKKFFSVLAALVRLVGRKENIFFLAGHYFNAFVPIAPAIRKGSAFLGHILDLLYFNMHGSGLVSRKCLILS
jgi:hypothetical protein